MVPGGGVDGGGDAGAGVAETFGCDGTVFGGVWTIWITFPFTTVGGCGDVVTGLTRAEVGLITDGVGD